MEIKNDSREKTKEYKYLSLMPTSSQEYEKDADLLYQKFLDTETKNVGIVAQYGAGKSSLIKTFTEKYDVDAGKKKRINSIKRRNRNKRIRTLNISLASFNLGKEADQDDAMVKDMDNAIEKSILQQMLFKKEKNNLPNSNIKRISLSKCKERLLILFTIASIIMTIFSFIMFAFEIKGDTQIFSVENGVQLWILLAIVFLFISIVMVVRFIDKISIKIKDVEISIDNKNTQESLLNKFLDEVIYFFQKTKYKIVFFEDLDRLNSLNIFIKLRELNTIINENERIKKSGKVMFVYAVKNDLFINAADRTKFFDFIISLMPVLTPHNAREKIKEALKNSGLGKNWLDDKYINDVYLSFENLRILNSTVNDCISTLENNDLSKITNANEMEKHRCLFSLMMYKNIYPDKFAELEQRKGELKDLLDNINKNKEKQKDKYKKEIKENEENINKIRETKEIYDKYLKYTIIGIIGEHGSPGRSGENLEEVEDFSKINGNIYVKFNAVGYSEYAYLNKSMIDKLLNKSLNEIQEEYNNNKNHKIDFYVQQNNELQNKINKLNDSGFDYIKECDEDILNSINITYLLRMLVTNGYITEDYRNYISKGGDAFFAEEDFNYLKNFKINKQLDYSYKLNQVDLIIEELTPEKFSNKGILNYQIINYLFNINERENQNEGINIKQENLNKLLNSRNDKIVLDFIINYFNSDIDWSKNFIEFLVKNNPLFINLVINSTNQINKKKQFIKYVLLNIEYDLLKEQQDINCINEFIEEDKDFIEDIEKYQLNFSILKDIQFKIKDLSIYKFSTRSLKIVEKNCLWVKTLDNITYLGVNLYGESKNNVRTKGISFVKSMDSVSKDYILSDLNYYVKYIMLEAIEIDLEEADFKDLICNESIDINNKIELIKKQKSNINYDVDINDDILGELFEYNKININLSDLSNFIQKTEDTNLTNKVSNYLFNNSKFYDNEIIQYEEIVYFIANCKQEQAGRSLFDLYKEKISNMNWQLNKIDNADTLSIIIHENNELSQNELAYLLSLTNKNLYIIIAEKFYQKCCQYEINNYNLDFMYLTVGRDISIKQEIYKKEIDFDKIKTDWFDVELFAKDVIYYKLQIADSIYRYIFSNSKYDIKKGLFVTQSDFWDKSQTLDKLKLFNIDYIQELVNKKEVIVPRDEYNEIIKVLKRKELIKKRVIGENVRLKLIEKQE